MGYNITIGELVPADPTEEDARDWAQRVTLPEAPAYGEPTDHTNERWPSYTSWANFLRATGLGFLSPNTAHFERRSDVPPLMEEHPGIMPVLPVHLEVITQALQAYREKIGFEKQPGWAEQEIFDKESGKRITVILPNPELYDGELARLTWLHFWVKWALENCTNPVCENT